MGTVQTSVSSIGYGFVIILVKRDLWINFSCMTQMVWTESNNHFENKNVMQLTLYEYEVKAAVQYIINGTSA